MSSKPMLRSDHRIHAAILVAILLLAAALRFYKLGEWSFWIDEVLTLRSTRLAYTQFSNWGGIFTPKLSLVLMRLALDVFGPGEWNARIVPAFVGTITILLLYFPTSKLFGSEVALLASLFLAISPWHIYASQNARYYAFLVLFVSLALLTFFIGISYGRRVYIALSVLLLYLAVGERLTALLAIPVIAVYLAFVAVQSHGHRARVYARYLLLIVLVFAAIVVYEVIAPALGAVSILEASDMTKFIGTANHSPLRLLLSLVFRLTIPLVCLGAFGVMHVVMKKNRAGLYVAASALVPPLILILLASFMFTVDRYVITILPFWAILGAISLKEMYSEWTDMSGRLFVVTVGAIVVATMMGEKPTVLSLPERE